MSLYPLKVSMHFTLRFEAGDIAFCVSTPAVPFFEGFNFFLKAFIPILNKEHPPSTQSSTANTIRRAIINCLLLILRQNGENRSQLSYTGWNSLELAFSSSGSELSESFFLDSAQL